MHDMIMEHEAAAMGAKKGASPKMAKMVRSSYTMNSDDYELLQQVKRAIGSYTDSDGIRHAIRLAHKQLVAPDEKAKAKR
jgi:hypothetical protein